MLDARRDESPLQWLQTINAFAAGATVLIAVNQIDLNAHPKLNQQELRATYPNIAAVFYTSCKHDQDHGLTQLITELKHRLAQLPSMGDTYPQQWYEIKEELEREQGRGRHYMSIDSYRDFCTEYGMENAEANSDPVKTFLGVLDTIGTVRWFRNFEYFDYQVLDPSWLTIGLYHILINGEVKQRSGLVSRQQIKGILLYDIPKQYLERGYKYRERDIDFFVEAIQHYKFAFKVEHSDDTTRYRIPKGFPQDPPARLNLQTYQGDDHRLYTIEFTSFAPAWLLHRLIVSLHRSIPEELYWFYGFVYRSAEGDTLVNLFEHERKLFIRVPKSAPNVYPLLRFCLFDIFAETMQLELQEWVMFGEDNQSRASLQQLRRYAAKGIQLYPRPQHPRRIPSSRAPRPLPCQHHQRRHHHRPQTTRNTQDRTPPRPRTHKPTHKPNQTTPNPTRRNPANQHRRQNQRLHGLHQHHRPNQHHRPSRTKSPWNHVW